MLRAPLVARFGIAAALVAFGLTAAFGDPPAAPSTAAPAAQVTFSETIYIAKPASAVWQAITDPKIVDRYFMAPLAQLDLKPGGTIRYATSKTTIVSGTVLEVIPNKELKHTFRMVGYEQEPETTVTYEIDDIGPMCALTITHSGFPSENGTYGHISFGWPWMLSRLKTLLETGRPLTWPKGK